MPAVPEPGGDAVDGVKLKLRFHCAIPSCQGVVPSGANLWEHALEHNAQATQRREAEARAALITRNHQCQGCGTPFPFAWQLRDGFCRKCKL